MSKCSTCLKMSRYGYCDNMSSMDIGDRNPCVDGSMYEPRRFTNADRIRSMSDEELAKWMLDWLSCDNDGYMCTANRYKNSKRCDGHCTKNHLDWLQQPAEE